MPIRRVLLATVAALAVSPAPAAAAGAGAGETYPYALTPGVERLTRTLALEMLEFDLAERAGMAYEAPEDVSCAVRRRSATCSYRAPNPYRAELGIDAGVCVVDGRVRLTHGGRRAAITQALIDC